MVRVWDAWGEMIGCTMVESVPDAGYGLISRFDIVVSLRKARQSLERSLRFECGSMKYCVKSRSCSQIMTLLLARWRSGDCYTAEYMFRPLVGWIGFHLDHTIRWPV